MLYNKHLTSLEDLQAERAAIKLNAKKKALSVQKELKKKDKDKSDPLQKGISFLSGSMIGNSNLAPIVEIATQFGLPLLLKRGAQFGVRKIAMTAIKEVTFGYVKWKAISIAATLISNQIKKRKHKLEKEAK